MPSLISQLRSGMQPQAQPQSQPQQQTQWVKGLMSQLKASSNPQQTLMSMIESNPQFAQITQMMKTNGGNLEALAKQMAQQQGIDLNKLIQELTN